MDVGDSIPKRISFSISTNSGIYFNNGRHGQQYKPHTLVFLTEDFRKFNRPFDGLHPRCRLESKLDGCITFVDWRKLEEVTCHHKLVAPLLGQCVKARVSTFFNLPVWHQMARASDV